MVAGFRYAEGLKMFQSRIQVIPQAADDLKKVARTWLSRLDRMIEGREFICGNRLTLADVFLFCFLDFGNGVGQKLDPENRAIQAWYERMKARPSAAA